MQSYTFIEGHFPRESALHAFEKSVRTPSFSKDYLITEEINKSRRVESEESVVPKGALTFTPGKYGVISPPKFNIGI